MKHAMVVLLAVSAAVGLSGCNSSSSVPWEDYAPSVRSVIDGAAADRDCATLQEAFNNADSTSEITRGRTGHNNADLMSYIDEKMRAAGCYG